MKSQTVVLVAVLLAITVPISYGHHHESHDQQEDHDPAAAAPAVPEEKLASRIQTSMESAEIVPDVVGRAPSQLITVSSRNLETIHSTVNYRPSRQFPCDVIRKELHSEWKIYSISL